MRLFSAQSLIVFALLHGAVFFAQANPFPLEKRVDRRVCNNQIQLRVTPKAIPPLVFVNYTDGDKDFTIEQVDTQPTNAKNEHVLEVQVIRTLMESPDGPCNALANACDDEDKANIMLQINQIITILNAPKNLFPVERTLETLKGTVVKQFFNNANAKDPKKKNKPIPDNSSTNTNFLNQLVAVNKYLNVQFKQQALDTASAIDQIVENSFPNTPANVRAVATWTNILTFAETQIEQVLRNHQLDIQGNPLQ